MADHEEMRLLGGNADPSLWTDPADDKEVGAKQMRKVERWLYACTLGWYVFLCAAVAITALLGGFDDMVNMIVAICIFSAVFVVSSRFWWKFISPSRRRSNHEAFEVLYAKPPDTGIQDLRRRRSLDDMDMHVVNLGGDDM